MNQLSIIDEQLLEKVVSLNSFIGNTPLFPIANIFQKENVKIYAKLEWMQLGGSVKARPAYNIILEAIKTGELNSDKVLLDATSGNTGLAYASIAAALQIPVTIVIPENASSERKSLLKAYGAKLIYTSKFDGTDGAQIKAKELYAENPEKYYYADQYNNQANWKAHYKTTAQEILYQTKSTVTHFVAGLGTTGTFVGTSRGLRELNPTIHFISLQPETALHGLEGWKHLETARVPGIYDNDIADINLTVDTEEAYKLIKETSKKEGLILSPSSAANLAGAIRVANSIHKGVVVTVFPDDGSKYKEILTEIYKHE